MGNAADGSKVVLGKGMLWIDRFDAAGASTGLRASGACTEVILSPGNVDVVELKDPTTELSGLLASDVIGQEPQMKFTMRELSPENLALFTMGTTATESQTAATVTDEAVGTVKQGRKYFLSKTHLTSVTNVKVGAAVKTGYQVDLRRGTLYINEGGDIADGDAVTCTYVIPNRTTNKVLAATTGNILAAIHFVSANTRGPKWDLRGWRVSIQPEGDLGMITTDYASFGCNGKFLSDAGNHPLEPYYALRDMT